MLFFVHARDEIHHNIFLEIPLWKYFASKKPISRKKSSVHKEKLVIPIWQSASNEPHKKGLYFKLCL